MDAVGSRRTCPATVSHVGGVTCQFPTFVWTGGCECGYGSFNVCELAASSSSVTSATLREWTPDHAMGLVLNTWRMVRRSTSMSIPKTTTPVFDPSTFGVKR